MRGSLICPQTSKLYELLLNINVSCVKRDVKQIKKFSENTKQNILDYLCFSIICASSPNISPDNQYSTVNKKTTVSTHTDRHDGIKENVKMLQLQKGLNSYQFRIL